jgi:hypothetical protein
MQMISSHGLHLLGLSGILLFKGHRYTQGVPGVLFKGTDSINRLSR